MPETIESKLIIIIDRNYKDQVDKLEKIYEDTML